VLPPQHPVELTAVAYDIYRKFEMWLKKKGLMRLADADETYANEDPLASCLRGSLGIGQVVELDEAGDVQYSQEQADEKRFALRKSPHAGELEGFGIHARVTVHAADKDGRERLIRYCARPATVLRRVRSALILEKAVRAGGSGLHADGGDYFDISFTRLSVGNSRFGQGEGVADSSVDRIGRRRRQRHETALRSVRTGRFTQAGSRRRAEPNENRLGYSFAQNL
jgi:hypothetical protein